MLRYVDNPNGSVDDIAGICNEGRNVVGLMPHPERAVTRLLGSTDGLPLLRSLLADGRRTAGLSRSFLDASRLAVGCPSPASAATSGQPARVMPAA